jgi:uncharacterized cupredoxin-like copper-binding protein
MISKSILSFILCSLVSIAGVALASGTHSTGNGHGDETIGKPGTASQVTRTVNIDMNDAMRFVPANITVKKGETIRFKLKNSGKMDHEFVLGTEQELKKHNELMEKFPEMEHDDPNMITVAPGETGGIIWHFTKKGKVNFACLIPGHFDDGMKGNVKVLP